MKQTSHHPEGLVTASAARCPPGSSAEPFKPRGTCILLVTDVAGYGSLRTRSAQEELRAQHYRMLEDCLSDAEIRPETCYWEDRGDGVIVAIPAHHEALVLVSPFVDNLQYWLRSYNINVEKEQRIRLRVALHIGETYHDGRGLTGTDVNLVFRLIDSAMLKGALKESSASLAFIVSETFYQTVLKNAPRPVDPDVFSAITVLEKETQTTAWIQLRGKADPRAPVAQDDGAEELCPYPGLAPFGLENVRWFFGRERVTADLLQRLGGRLRGSGPLVVVGPSGVGKSSLLRAGLVHGLKSGNLAEPGSRDWPRLVFTPTAEPVRELAAQLAGLAVVDPEPHSVPQLVEALCEVLRETPGSDAGRLLAGIGRVVIVVDQFEEIFTLCSDERQRREFVRALCKLAAGHAGGAPPALVVLGLRADCLGQCVAYPELVQALRDDPVWLEPMSPAELRDAIEKPAHAIGLDLEPGLVEILLRDLGVPQEPAGAAKATYDPGALPLLSHALRATWQQRGGGILTLDGYQITGRIRGAIAKTTERVYQHLDSAGQETARRLLLRMIKITEDSETRRQVDRRALLDESADPAAAAVLEELATARLVTLDENTLEISHDALLREWPQLREWIDTNRTGLLIRQRLIEDADAWARENKRPWDLYRGPRLTDARAWAETDGNDGDLNTLAREFLDASIEAHLQEERAAYRRARRLHQLVVGLAILFLLALATSVVAVLEQQTAARQRNQALAGQVASEASTLLQSQPELALLLSVQAFRVDESTESLNSLLSAQARYYADRLATDGPAYSVAFSADDRWIVSAQRGGVDIRYGLAYQHASAVVSGRAAYGVAFSPDRRTVAIACQDGNVLLWGSRDRRFHVLPGTNRRGPANGVAFSPDGRTVASTAYDGVVRLWDVATRRLVGELASASDPGPVEAVAFSPDGRTLASAGAGPAVILWDIASRSVSARLTGHIGPVRAVAFSPNGRVLASGGDDGVVKLWDRVSGALLANLGGHIGPVRAVAFSPNGRVLASGGDDASVRLWDVAARSLLTSLTGPTGPVAGVTFSPDGGILASANADSSIGLWRLGAMGSGTPSTVSALARTVSGTPILATADADHTIQLWDARSGGRIGSLGGHLHSVNALALSQDGRMLAAADGGDIVLWHLSSRAAPAVLREEGGQVSALAFSSDGRTLAAASGRTLTFWDVLTGRRAGTLTPSPSQIDTVQFSPDGRTVASGNDDRTVTLTQVPYSPGNKGSVTSTDCSGHLGSVVALAFSPRGDLLASASTDHTVKLWKLPGCTLLHTFTDHTQAVVAVAFGDGVLASAGVDGYINLWDVRSWRRATYKEIASLSSQAGDTPPTGATSLMFGPARGILVSVDPDGRPVLWDTNPRHVIDRVCRTRPVLPGNWPSVPRALPPPC